MLHMLGVLFISFALFLGANSILFAQRNEHRSYDQLDGLWYFVREPSNSIGLGLENVWHLRNLRLFLNYTIMPVPSAFNDLGVDAELRDHTGWVWYQRNLYVNRALSYRMFLRFSSVNYYAIVFVNGQEVGRHVGGHLPFEFEVTAHMMQDVNNRITVAVNNTLSHSTIPLGEFEYAQETSGDLVRYPPGFFRTKPNFDFFNYAGILRPVYLLKKPWEHIHDITVRAEADGKLQYNILVSAGPDVKLFVKVLDGEQIVYSALGASHEGVVPDVKLWWPRGMGEPKLYTLEVELIKTSSGEALDAYRLRFGFRSVTWDHDQIFINGRPFYCIGFGMHEDADIRGRGYDPVIMTKDLNLLEWMGANCYRTSHYPYAEERAFEADRRGIAVITETPGVGLKKFNDDNLKLHQQMLRETIDRDRNHPSTIMWSLANEPKSGLPESRPYFHALVAYAHSFDNSRPAIVVYGGRAPGEMTADLVDIIGVNLYNGWYNDMGYLDTVNRTLVYDLMLWKKTFNKPIIFAEYGADAIIGLSELPSLDFSMQYQDEIIQRTHEALNELRKNKVVAGEMIWNFADFMTAQGITRAVGNHKGMFTRDRKPKPAAYTLKERYLSLLRQ